MHVPNAPQACIRFAPGWPERLVLFARAERAKLRSPREDQASASARGGQGVGEFAGRRRYRPGDDLRSFDWEALARGAGPLVRLRQAESAERWAVLLDASASMAVGVPAKLQLAAELALAAVALGLELGGDVSLSCGSTTLVLRARSQLGRALTLLEGMQAQGGIDLRGWAQDPRVARASRWILVGDLLGQNPADLGTLAQRPRRLDAIAVLAAAELAPLTGFSIGARVAWRDPENGEERRVRLGTHEVAAFERELSLHLELWRAHVARKGGRLLVCRSTEAFEPQARRLFSSSGP